MRKTTFLVKLLVFALVAILSIAVLVGCGGDKTDGETAQTGDVAGQQGGNADANVTKYNVGIAKGSELGKVEASALRSAGEGTVYEFTVTPKAGYVVKTFKIGGVALEVKENKASCVLKGDAVIEVEYERKASEELEKRRQKVHDEMYLITSTYFQFDRDYDYKITSAKGAKISKDKLYRGMPYSNFPTVPYRMFVEDFTTGPDENGIYQVKNIWAEESSGAIVGNNCADAVYWAWTHISTTLDCVLSGSFSEPNGCVYVGTYKVDEKVDLDDKGGFKKTLEVCEKNGMFTMFDSYALLKKGDALMNATNGAGHIVLVSDVKIVRGSDGKVNGDRSYVVYLDQNSGYSDKPAFNGKQVQSSCSAGDEQWTLTELFNDGYIPVTCKELMDDSTPIEEEWIKDSLDESKLTTLNVLRGYIESNYYFSKIRMEITDANGNTVFAANRYRDELNPKRVALSWFKETNGTEYKDKVIYDSALNMDALASGTYNCKVTVWLASGNSYVARDFQFTK